MMTGHDLEDSLKPTDTERALILGTMGQWLSGQPVWPLKEVLSLWGGDFAMYRRHWDRQSLPDYKRAARLYTLRAEAISAFGFAIPSAELLQALAALQPLVEIGAGTGYITALARHRGIDIVGCDPAFGHGYGFQPGLYDDQQIKLPGKTAVRHFRDRNVFCSWPTLGATWFRQALRAMRISRRLIVIREDACAEDSAWQYVDDCFIREGEVEIPAWPNMNDQAEVYCKVRQRAKL